MHDASIFVCALLTCSHDSAILNKEKVFCSFNRLDSMSDHDYCQITFHFFGNVKDSCLHFLLAFRVKCTSSLIKYQNLWLFDQCTSNGNSLLLASRQVLHRTGTNISVKAIFHSENEISICLLKSHSNILVICVWVSIHEVFADGSDNENWLLANISDALP